jgi:hypothetical protein
MPTFDFLPLLWWGLPLVAAPVVIHLINLLRHRQVRWAAMELLLASQRKYRTRVLLKQILLLLLRVAAVLGVVLALAQPRWQTALGQLLGGGRTAHMVLLDDSYSMADRTAGGRLGETTAFDRGRLVVERICGELAAAPGVQEMSIGRFSRFGRAGSGDRDPGRPAEREGAAAARDADPFDFRRQQVTPERVQQIRDALAAFAPSQTDAGPREPLAAAVELFNAEAGAATGGVLWLVSDFRAKDWKSADDTAELLRRISAAGVQVRLVDCAADGAEDGGPPAAGEPANLSVERLQIAGGVPATGVLVPMEVAVRNHSDRPVRGVPIELREDGAVRPGLRIEEIPAGGIAAQRFEVRFQKAGGHVVDARIPADAVAADDARTAVVDVSDRVDVLVIDGDPRGGAGKGDAFYLATALAPGSGAPTGLRPRIEPPRSLATLDLEPFDCIWLLDVAQLDPPEIAALEAFAKGGGGVVFFTGPRTKAETVNRLLHRGGDGLFPVPLAGPVDLLPDAGEGSPDVMVEEHPVVAVLSGQRNPLLGAVRVDRFLAVERGFEPPAGSGLRRLLSLRNGAPLVVERPFGDGLVVAVLTTAAPTWNNWARGNPSWVVVMLELESHLATARRRAQSLEVGDTVAVELEPGLDAIDVDFIVPPDGALVHQTAQATPQGSLVAALPSTAAGGYAVRWKRLDGTERERIVAVNVDPDEGRLERIGRERLDRTLSGVSFRYDSAVALEPDSGSLAGVSLVHPLIYALLAVLIAEQLLSYSASYHVAGRSKASS